MHTECIADATSTRHSSLQQAAMSNPSHPEPTNEPSVSHITAQRSQTSEPSCFACGAQRVADVTAHCTRQQASVDPAQEATSASEMVELTADSTIQGVASSFAVKLAVFSEVAAVIPVSSRSHSWQVFAFDDAVTAPLVAETVAKNCTSGCSISEMHHLQVTGLSCTLDHPLIFAECIFSLIAWSVAFKAKPTFSPLTHLARLIVVRIIMYAQLIQIQTVQQRKVSVQAQHCFVAASKQRTNASCGKMGWCHSQVRCLQSSAIA